jgi:agmatinase
MRRVAERCSLVQVGIRSLSIEEARAIPSLPTKVFFAKDIVGRGHEWMEDAVESLTRDVYLTIDIDGLDPSLCPDTGTPEPGGLGWYETLALIAKVAKERNIVGMDVVEVNGGQTAFIAAKLIYKTLGYVFVGQPLMAADRL